MRHQAGHSFLPQEKKKCTCGQFERDRQPGRLPAAYILTFSKVSSVRKTVGIDDILSAGHYNQARNEGKIRLENKEYVIKEADVILFRFNK